MTKNSNILIILLTIGLTVISVLYVYHVFSTDPSALTVELSAAMVAVVLVIVSVGVTVHYQSDREIQKEFKVELYRTKIGQYQKYIAAVVACDDAHIDLRTEEGKETFEKHVDQVQNISREICLIASVELIENLSEYLKKITKNRSIYFPDDQSATFRHVIAAMRQDLDVIETKDKRDKKSLEKVMCDVKGMMEQRNNTN